jgi:hypothetical protein
MLMRRDDEVKQKTMSAWFDQEWRWFLNGKRLDGLSQIVLNMPQF